MRKRTVTIHFAMTLAIALLVARLYYICTGAELASAADMQSYYTLELGNIRGIFYDCNMVPITNNQGYNAVAVVPTPEAATALMKAVSPAERGDVALQLQNMTPFVVRTTGQPVYAKGVENFTLKQRYTDDQIAAHLIGYTQAGGSGVTGLELALDDILSAQGGKLLLNCYTDAARRPIEGRTPERVDSGYDSGEGVVLTLDSGIQRIAESAALSIEKGSVVVMEVVTGDIKAMVSRPSYNPNKLADYLEDPDSPLINRALYDYAVGSSFKMLVAATALEQGIPAGLTYDCPGYIEVDGQRFNCHNLEGHGTLDMWGALQRSCNPYFVNLAQLCGAQTLASKAEQIGFGSPMVLAGNYQTRAGLMPSRQELAMPGQAANFAFGQGSFSASPVHIAAMVAAIANGGETVLPRLIVGYTDSGERVDDYLPTYGTSQVVTRSAANRVRQMLVSVVEAGSGRNAMPAEGGAGGKTASAQTGIYDEEGNEVVHAWFTGFFPADNPRHVIVVLNEGGDSGSDMACPIFKEIADNMNALLARRASGPDA